MEIRSRYDGGFQPTASIVVVTPHPALELIAPGPVEITEGESKDIPVKINNTGNVDVDFILEVEGVNRMENLGLEVILPAEEENTVEFSSFFTYGINLTGTGDIDGDSKADLDLFLLDADSGARYQEVSIVVEIREKEEGGGNGDGGGDDDDDGGEGDGSGDGGDQNGDEPEDQPTEEAAQPRTSGSRVLTIIGVVAVVIILAVVVYFIFRKSGKS